MPKIDLGLKVGAGKLKLQNAEAGSSVEYLGKTPLSTAFDDACCATLVELGYVLVDQGFNSGIFF